MKCLKLGLIVLVIMILLCSCGGKNTSSEIILSNAGASSEENERNAVLALYDYFGTSDKKTGTAYSFSIIDTVTVDDTEYYHGRWSTLSSEEDGTVLNSSLYKEFFLKKDLTMFYEGTYDYSNSTANFTSNGINISR